jgi:hypothetical protein
MAEGMHTICNRINRALQEDYGLTHDVVYVDSSGHLDVLRLIDGGDQGTMHNLALTIEHLCDLSDGAAKQLRMF